MSNTDSATDLTRSTIRLFKHRIPGSTASVARYWGWELVLDGVPTGITDRGYGSRKDAIRGAQLRQSR